MKILVFFATVFIWASAHAMTCTVTCKVSYPVDLGWVTAEGPDCSSSLNSAAGLCHALPHGYAGESSCVPLGNNVGGGTRTSLHCHGEGNDSMSTTISADSQQDAYVQAQKICPDWCNGYPKTSFGTNGCSGQGGACVP